MGNIFSRPKSEPQPYEQQPGLPGWQQGAEQLINQLSGWLSSPQTMPGYATLAGGMGAAGLGMARRQEMLDPNWLSQRSPIIQQLAESWTRQQRVAEQDIGRKLKMDYGSMGGAWSSPMVGAIAKAQLGSRENLAQQIGGAEYADYARKLGLQSGAISEEMQRPFQFDQAMMQRLMAVLGPMLSYSLGGRPQTGMAPGATYGSSPFEQILKGLAQGWVTQQTGLGAA
jgi:hypothetical protein